MTPDAGSFTPMTSIAVRITRFVDEHEPGFVECTLVDATRKKHTFVEKAPVVNTENLWSTSVYPCQGAIACEVQERWYSPHGEEFVQVSTERPWSIESTEGLSSFVVAASQLTATPSEA